MNIIPNDKYDLDACKRLKTATDKEVFAELNELLEWTQDINWPVAIEVVNRLKLLGIELADPLNKILIGKDDPWKYYLIIHLIPHVKKEVFLLLQSEIKRIVLKPTNSEIEEEVHLEAKELFGHLFIGV